MIAEPQPFRRPRPSGAVIAGLAIAVCLLGAWLRLPRLDNERPTWDELDYRAAASDGFWAMYLGTNTIPLWTLASRFENDTAFHAHPWAALFDEHDNLAVRHFHVPISFYPSAVLSSWGVSNLTHRIAPALVSSACAAVVLLGCVYLGSGWIGGVVGAVLVAIDPRLIDSSLNLVPHPYYIFLALAFLVVFASWLDHPTPLRQSFSVVLFGLAIATMELAPLLGIAAIVAAFLSRGRGFRYLREWQWGRSLLVLLSVLFVAWPAGVLRLGYITAYAVFGGLALLKREAYYGNAGLVSLYYRLFGPKLPWGIITLILIAFAIAGWRRLRHSPLFVTSGTYAVLALGTNYLNRFRNVTYAAEVTPFLWLTLGATLGPLAMGERGPLQRAAATAGIAIGAAATIVGLVGTP